MFGYIYIDQPEIRFKDFYRYRSYYCGLCRELGRRHGLLARLSLGYDLTFLALLLDGLYDDATEVREFRCPAHPLKKRQIRNNLYTEYASDMNLLLTWYKCMDDWNDEKKLSRRIYAAMIHRRVQKIEARYPRQAGVIRREMEAQQVYEATGERHLDTAAGFSGRMIAELFVLKEDVWEKPLREIGFYLGKFIYILDAYEDVETDRQHRLYNPLEELYNEPDFDRQVEQALMLMISAGTEAFEYLPVDENLEILRNILYSGVWLQFHRIREEKRKGMENGNRSL